MKTRLKRSTFKDKRRQHHYWRVTLYYSDGEKFARTYVNRERAVAFAKRQKNSPVVKRTEVVQLS